MVVVAQLVESRIVIPVVVGSNPIDHPKNSVVKTRGYKFWLVAFFVFRCRTNFGVPHRYSNLVNTDQRSEAQLAPHQDAVL